MLGYVFICTQKFKLNNICLKLLTQPVLVPYGLVSDQSKTQNILLLGIYWHTQVSATRTLYVTLSYVICLQQCACGKSAQTCPKKPPKPGNTWKPDRQLAVRLKVSSKSWKFAFDI